MTNTTDVILQAAHQRFAHDGPSKTTMAAIAHIIQQGIDQQFISCLDAKQTAYDIHQATLRYNNPITLQSHPLKLLQSDLNRLLDLLTMGLHRR